MTAAVWTLLLAYLFGSIPAGVLVARTYGVDIRKVGSGNIGATNVLRALGWGPALVVAFFDVFKGGIAVLVARAFGLSDWMLGGVALMAVLGHNYSVFLRFRGGKGVATSYGTLLFLDPALALWTFPIGLSVILLTRYVSAGSMTGGVAAFVLSLALGRPLWEVATVFLMALLIFWTHRENLKRLQEGTERRLGGRAEARWTGGVPKEEILALLRSRWPELCALGVAELYLFGSLARGLGDEGGLEALGGVRGVGRGRPCRVAIGFSFGTCWRPVKRSCAPRALIFTPSSETSWFTMPCFATWRSSVRRRRRCPTPCGPATPRWSGGRSPV